MKRQIACFCLLAALGAPCVATADYYECKSADGGISHSVLRCAKGEEQRRVADVGEAITVRLGGGGGTMQVAGSGRGHFVIAGAVNGVQARMLVDTGASLVSISPSAARRMGIDINGGRSIVLHTANGQTRGTAVNLQSVEGFGAAIANVAGVVMSTDMKGHDVLLGMSFLQHFDMNIEGNLLSVRRK